MHEPKYDLSVAFGTTDKPLQLALMRQLENAATILPLTSRESQVNAFLSALTAMQPRDVIEAQIAIQMVFTQNASADSFRYYAEAGRDRAAAGLELALALKATKAFGQLKEALDRHRGLGLPTMTVEQVTVEAGGQAIVGMVDAERRRPAALDVKSGSTLDLEESKPVRFEDARIKRSAT